MSTPDRIEVYKSGLRRQWRWRYRHSNGHILADSGESYARRIDCVTALQRVMGGVWCPVDRGIVKGPSGVRAKLPTEFDDLAGTHAFIVRDENVLRVKVLA